jgi:EAL domain-containing protein (putative c-di-GMP-specific phosphodiesterase class I)
VLFATGVSHTEAALRQLLATAGAAVVRRAPGLLEAFAADSAALLVAVREGLSRMEADEVRALAGGAQTGDLLLAAAFNAPTVAQSGARIEHADLLPLFNDEANAFRSVYQPIVSLAAGRSTGVIGYEALLRATSPAGPVMPDQMFTAAAAAGWLHVLDRVGRTSAIRGASGWLGDNLLFVNFVPTTIYRPEVCLRTTEEAAEQAGLRLDQLVFEVTESERVPDIEHLATVFEYYKRRGCMVALDDLGAGFSSLNMLIGLRPDIVKLDKQIVQGLPDPVSTAAIGAIVAITHSYGGLVLAECIETAEQAEAAAALDVDLGQGWLFGHPQPREHWLASPAPLAATFDVMVN